jgi:hypothetical protein
MSITLQEAADSEDLEAAWRYIQADFKVAFAKRNRLYDGQVGFWELMFSGGLSKLIAKAEAEVDRLHVMLKAIDTIRTAARREAALETLF